MGYINLYKIDPDKQDLFLQEIVQKFDYQGSLSRENVVDDQIYEYNFKLYLSNSLDDKEINWRWVFQEFEIPEITCKPNPKSVIVIQINESLYAISFGYSFFFVDKYCDKNFGFDFARKIKFCEVKTTSLTSPQSHRNKTINSYINYTELEFDSGESFMKIKGKIQDQDFLNIFKPTIEIGNSIKFTIDIESLDTVINLINYVKTVQSSEIEYYKIPVFSKVTDSDLLQVLEIELQNSIIANPLIINVSELDIIGVTEVFNDNNGDFILQYKRKQQKVSQLSAEVIKEFCNINRINFSSEILDIKVTSQNNNVSINTDCIRNLIDYTDDKNRCLLSRGHWYHYNDDYLEYLRDSISEIEVTYNPDYDFNDQIHNDFIDNKFSTEKNEKIYIGKTDKEIKSALKLKYYSERSYNMIRSEKDGFVNHDRSKTIISGLTIEIMDLYKNHSMFAVKFGNSSSKLCYVVDQSLSSLKLYKYGKLENAPKIENVVVWLILERGPLPVYEDGTPNLSELEMLMLKNKIDQWKKEVRLAGCKPIIYINYRT
jgi:uncharacterized protein (TIGR04141 family)